MIKKLLFILSFCAFIGTAHAQSFMIGPQLGYFAPSEEGSDGSLLFGGAARLKLGSLGVEAAINYRSEKSEDYGVTTKATFYPIMVSGLLYPLPILYATAGIGWYNIKAEIESSYFDYSETFSEIGYHIGGGVELPLGNMILSGDIKYIFLKYQFEEGYSSADVKADGFLINATLFFKLN